MTMSRELQQKMNPDSLDERQAIHFGFTRQILMPSFQEMEMQRQVEDDITELKEQLEQKDFQITNLKKKVKDLEDNNNDLLIKLDAKDEEVKNLKERIQVIEGEKKVLQEELASVQFKLKTVEDDVKKLSKLRENDEQKFFKLEDKFKKMQYRLDGIVEVSEATKAENDKLKVEIKQVRHQARHVPGVQPLLPVQASDEAAAMRELGEMCYQIQDKMYKKILPEYYTPIRSCKVKAFERDIEKLSKTEDEKEQAIKRWEELKGQLNWSEDLEEALDALQEMYSRSIDSKPPKLYEKNIRTYATILGKQGILKGWVSLDRVNSLIDIWKSPVLCG